MTPDDQQPRGETILLQLNQVYPVMRKLFGIKKAGLFGAVARGERTEGPAEILVGFQKGHETYKNYTGLASYHRDARELPERDGRP
jgi:predicted nucleotidyltransferase